MMRHKKKKMGCCGYDELAYKPPTTRPMFASNVNAKKLHGQGGFGAGILYPITNIPQERRPQ
jgi:hypothetical protein